MKTKYTYNVYVQTSKAFCDDALNFVEEFDNPDDAMTLCNKLNLERIDKNTYREVAYHVILEKEE